MTTVAVASQRNSREEALATDLALTERMRVEAEHKTHEALLRAIKAEQQAEASEAALARTATALSHRGARVRELEGHVALLREPLTEILSSATVDSRILEMATRALEATA